MSKSFRKVIDDIAISASENGGVTTQDLLTAMIAGHDEAEETARELAQKTEETAARLAEELRLQHQSSLDAIELQKTLIENHLSDANVRDARITKLEAYKEDQQLTCADKVKALVEREHNARHSAYVESIAGESTVLQIMGRRVWVLWGVALFLATVIANGLIMFWLDKVLHP